MTQKETDRPRHTHKLKTAEGESCQDTEGNRLSKGTHALETGKGGTCQGAERNQLSEVHSPTGDGRGRNLSGHGNKPTKQGALTSWKQQREGLVRTQKETDRARGTYVLEMAEGGTRQDTETN